MPTTPAIPAIIKAADWSTVALSEEVWGAMYRFINIHNVTPKATNAATPPANDRTFQTNGAVADSTPCVFEMLLTPRIRASTLTDCSLRGPDVVIPSEMTSPSFIRVGASNSLFESSTLMEAGIPIGSVLNTSAVRICDCSPRAILNGPEKSPSSIGSLPELRS